jgi:hypothetical protein
MTALAVLGGALACAAPSHAAETIVATESDSTPVATYHGVAAWWSTQSEQAGQHRVVRLKIYEHGRTRLAPVPPVRYPNDLDLGPDARGRVTAVYSRCSRPVTPIAVQMGCHLYRYTLGGHEHRIKHVSRTGYSERNPTIWRSRVAYARFRDADEAPVDRIYLNDGRRNRRLPRGTFRPDESLGAPSAQTGRLDLRGNRLGFSWYYPLAICRTLMDQTTDAPPTVSELWLVNLTTHRSRRLERGCSDDNTGVLGPSLQPNGVWYLRGLRDGPFSEQRDDYAGHSTKPAAIAPVPLAYDRDGSSVLSVRQVDNPDPTGRPGVFQVVLST